MDGSLPRRIAGQGGGRIRSFDHNKFLLGGYNEQVVYVNNCILLEAKEPLGSFLRNYWSEVWHNAAGQRLTVAESDEIAKSLGRYSEWAKSKRKLLPKINPFLLHDIDLQLHALGVPVAALTGWSASADQIALLRDRGVRFVTLLLDGDDTGRRGRERVLPDLAASFFVSAPLLADGQKPDTLCEAELRELVALP